MQTLINIFRDAGYSHHVIEGRTRHRREMIDSCLNFKGGIYIVTTDRIITQDDWEQFALYEPNPSLRWNESNIPMTSNVLYVGMSRRNLKMMVDRHLRGGYSEARALKLSHSYCPFFYYTIHVFYREPSKTKVIFNLRDLIALVQKMFRPVLQ